MAGHLSIFDSAFGPGNTLLDRLLARNTTPGILPGLENPVGPPQSAATPSSTGIAPSPRVAPIVPPTAPDGVFGKIDSFLGGKGGNFLLNLLAQQGSSLLPTGGPLGAIGRAGVASQQQQQRSGLAEAQQRLIEARIKATNNPAAKSRGTPILVKDPITGKSTFQFPGDAVNKEPGVRPSSASPSLKLIKDPETGKSIFVNSADALGEEAASPGKPDIEITEAATELAAARFRLNGTIPPGFTRQPQVVANIIERAAQQAKEAGLDVNQVMDVQQEHAANAQAIKALEKQRTLVGSFEKTAAKNMDLAVELGKKVGRSGSPIVNSGIIAFKQHVTGDADTASFVNALTAARTEYAKVLSGATGAAGITDSARKEATELFDTVTSQETLEAVIDVAKQEMQNRIDSFEEQKMEFRVGNRNVDFGRPVPEGDIQLPSPEELAVMTPEERALFQ